MLPAGKSNGNAQAQTTSLVAAAQIISAPVILSESSCLAALGVCKIESIIIKVHLCLHIYYSQSAA